MPYDYGDETGYCFEGIGGSQERNGGLMEAALVLARFWGIILVALCVSMLLNVKFYVRLVKGLFVVYWFCFLICPIVERRLRPITRAEISSQY